MPPQMYERGDKESHLETIKYEIDMLDFCFQGWLERRDAKNRGEWNIYVEGFLLHFRNLAEFFAGAESRHGRGPSKTDLSISKPEDWAPTAIEPNKLNALTNAKLYQEHFDDISRFLQHCTDYRAERSKKWNVQGMFEEIDHLLPQFCQLCALRRLEQLSSGRKTDAFTDGCSTASVSWSESALNRKP